MARLVVRVDPMVEEGELAGVLEPVVEVLRGGGIAIYPTDTVYGVGGRIDLGEAVEKVAQAKQRGASPFPILLSSVGDAERLAHMGRRARLLAREFWPGPLTLKLEPRVSLHPRLLDGEGRVAVRVPDHPVPRVLARGIGGYIVGTSANRSGAPSPTTLDEALAQIGDRVDVAVDGGPSRYRVASTIVDVTVTPPRVVRVGAVGVEEIEEILGEEVVVESGKP